MVGPPPGPLPASMVGCGAWPASIVGGTVLAPGGGGSGATITGSCGADGGWVPAPATTTGGAASPSGTIWTTSAAPSPGAGARTTVVLPDGGFSPVPSSAAGS